MGRPALLWVPAPVRPAVRVDLAAAVLYGLFGGLTLPFVAVMGRRLGASALQVSLLVAAPAAVMLVSLGWVNLIRRAPAVRLVVWAHALGRAALLAMPLVHAPGAYVALVLLYHALASVGSLGYAQVVREAYPAEVRARILGLVRVWMALAWVAAAAVGGRIMQAVPFQWVFAAAALVGVASALVFSRIRLAAPHTVEPPIAVRAVPGLLRRDPAYRRFLAGFFVFGFGAWLAAPAIPILLVDRLRATAFQVGLLGAVTSAAWVAAYVLWGRVLDRRPAPVVLVRIFLVGALAPVVYLLARNPWVVLVAGAADGVASAGLDLGWLSAVLRHAPPDQVRTYVAIYNTLLGIRGVAAPLLAAALLPQVGTGPVLLAAVGLMGLGALVMGAAARQARPDHPGGRLDPLHATSLQWAKRHAGEE